MIRVDQAPLVAILANAARVANARSDIQIEQCVHVAAADGTLTIRATNFTLWVTLDVPCGGDLAPVVVNAARLLDAVSQMRASVLSIDHDGTRLTIKGSGSARRSIPAVIEHFPSPVALTGEVQAGLDAGKFRDGVEFVRPFVGDETSKSWLRGVRIHAAQGAMRVVGASRSGMAYADVGGSLAEIAATLPPTFIDAIDRCLPSDGPFFLSVTDRTVEASWKGGVVRSPLIEESYPDYERAIPPGSTGKLSVNADELVAATKAARGLGHEDRAGGSTVVKFCMGETIEIIARSDKGEAIEPVDAEWAGEPCEIGMMSGQIVSGLSRLKSAPLLVEFGSPDSAVVFRLEKITGRLAVMMPVRI